MKSKESRPEEYFKEQIRTLEKQNKALKKRLRQLEKSKHVYQELKLDEELEKEINLEPIKPKLENCPNCARSGVTTVIIVGRIFKRCMHCEWRSQATRIDKNE